MNDEEVTDKVLRHGSPSPSHGGPEFSLNEDSTNRAEMSASDERSPSPPPQKRFASIGHEADTSNDEAINRDSNIDQDFNLDVNVLHNALDIPPRFDSAARSWKTMSPKGDGDHFHIPVVSRPQSRQGSLFEYDDPPPPSNPRLIYLTVSTTGEACGLSQT